MNTATEKSKPNRQNQPIVAALAHPILFFDGVCGLCSRAVDSVIARDPKGTFRFAPLQGETAHEMLDPADVEALDTMIVATESGIFRRSSAAVRILWRLGPFWKLCGWLLWVIPLPVRDLGYKIVANSRYRLFGKHETCRLPTPEERERFLP